MTIAVIGTKRLVATATHGGIHEMTARGIQEMTALGIHEMTDRSPEAVTPLGAAGRPRAAQTDRIDAEVDLRTTEDPQEEDQEVRLEADPVPGLAPGTATATAGSGRSRTRSSLAHCPSRLRSAKLGCVLFTAPSP